MAMLRARTDRQLMTLIERKLDLALTEAVRLAESCEPDSEAAAETQRRAEEACAEADQLLRVLGRAGASERALLESKRRELRRLLDDYCPDCGGRVRAACQ